MNFTGDGCHCVGKGASVACHTERLVFPSEYCLRLFIPLIAICSRGFNDIILAALQYRSDWSKLLSDSVGQKDM